MQVLITGGRGFLGRNLAARLSAIADCETRVFGREDSAADLSRWLAAADLIFHLAGVNRPRDVGDYEPGNAGLTQSICDLLREARHSPTIVFASSVQAELENPYGRSKRKAEQELRAFASQTGARLAIYRLKNLFGKWCRPNYNSVTATFCHNIALGLPISISDPDTQLDLSYVDDVVAAFVEELADSASPVEIPSYRIRLGELARRIQAFHESRATFRVPTLAERFDQALYATYLSYVPAEALPYSLDIRCDARGSLAEFIKSEQFGQVFVSRTNPGVTRGNHYHHTKTEKFLVVEGDALIRMRALEGGDVQQLRVRGTDYRVVNIPPGVTHSIENVGAGELVTLFWSSEIFNANQPDTYFLPVTPDGTAAPPEHR